MDFAQTEAPTDILERKHRLRRFSHMIRGGVVVGLLALATGSVILELAGLRYSTEIQMALGSLGALAGVIFGAREPA
jgi:hypothetical protein